MALRLPLRPSPDPRERPGLRPARPELVEEAA